MELEKKYEQDYESLLSIMNAQEESYNESLIRKAFELCVEAHKGQLRKSGEEYYDHPLNVAKIILSLGMDSESIAAALLHDVVEDTETTDEQIKQKFGEEVALLVDGVTKIGRIQYVSREQQQAESLRKMLIAMGKDIRVIVIKLADRLHNMRTLGSLPEHKQLEKSLETIEVYAPIAHRLGIHAIKEELEDLSIRHLDPVAYKEIEELLSERSHFREATFNTLKERIEQRLREEMPTVELVLQSRVKSIPGIYRKMFMQGRNFEEIYDVYAVRVITETVTDCYNVLGIMHDMFRPIPGRFKDYISTPKPNMYQSLHTTVIGRDAIPFEIQIRTFDMHHTAEFGIAAHWKYKEGITSDDKKMDTSLEWIRQVLESQSEDTTDLIRTIKVDLAQDVYAVTPKGDVISLPAGATVIDFAFAIHSAVGVRMVGAKVDGKIVQITHEVKTGEVIEILTTNAAGHGPSRDWLSIAVTSSAKAKIRSWFKKERREENIETGRNAIESEFRRSSIILPDADMQNFILDIAKRQRLASVEELYAAIGYGGVSLEKIMPRIKEDYIKLVKAAKETNIEEYIQKHTPRSHDGVIIEGIDNCLVKLSKCCAPLPGDDIIGFITRGHGVSVHKKDCVNVPRDTSSTHEAGRWIGAYWADDGKSTSFTSTIEITGLDRDGLLNDITNILFNMRVGLHAVNARTVKGGNCVMSVTVSAASVEHLSSIIAKLRKLSGVYSVERTNR